MVMCGNREREREKGGERERALYSWGWTDIFVALIHSPCSLLLVSALYQVHIRAERVRKTERERGREGGRESESKRGRVREPRSERETERDLLLLLPTSPLEVAASFNSTIPMVMAASGIVVKGTTHAGLAGCLRETSCYCRRAHTRTHTHTHAHTHTCTHTQEVEVTSSMA